MKPQHGLFDEALRAYTVGNAQAVFAERTRGRLKAGYKADIVLLDRDITTVRPEDIGSAGVSATIVGGKVVFEAQKAADAPARTSLDSAAPGR
jgi:predicted amidohydrolase YtcJ